MFMNDSTEVGRILNDLVQACNDSALRFHDAVGRLENEELRRIFHELETERETFALRLRQHVSRFGENPAETGTVTESVRRAGREFKSLVLRPDDAREVAVCAAGEDSLRRVFERTLPEVPDSLRPLIDEQHKEIVRNSRMLSELEHTMQESASMGT